MGPTVSMGAHQVLSLEYKADSTSLPTLTSTPPPRRKNINTPPKKFHYQGTPTIRLSYRKLDSYFHYLSPSANPLIPSNANVRRGNSLPVNGLPE